MVNCQRAVWKAGLSPSLSLPLSIAYAFRTNVDPLLLGVTLCMCLTTYTYLYLCILVSMGAYVMPHNWATFNCQKMEIILVKRQSHTLYSPLALSLGYFVYHFDLITNNLTTNCRTFKYNARRIALRFASFWNFVILCDFPKLCPIKCD